MGEGGLSIKGMGPPELERAGISTQAPFQQAQGGFHLIFTLALRLHVEQVAEPFPRDYDSDIAVIVLDAVSVDGMYRPLQTALAMAQITCGPLVPVEDRDLNAPDPGQRLVALQTVINPSQRPAVTVTIRLRINPPHARGAGQLTAQPLFPKRRTRAPGEGIQATQA